MMHTFNRPEQYRSQSPIDAIMGRLWRDYGIAVVPVLFHLLIIENLTNQDSRIHLDAGGQIRTPPICRYWPGQYSSAHENRTEI
jgi:hypothetical protein